MYVCVYLKISNPGIFTIKVKYIQVNHKFKNKPHFVKIANKNYNIL
jgi:hypothetical protein